MGLKLVDWSFGIDYLLFPTIHLKNFLLFKETIIGIKVILK